MTLRTIVRDTLSRIAPEAMAVTQAVRGRRRSQRWVRDNGFAAIGGRLIEKVGSQVLAGPFAGMKLSPSTRQEHVAPFLLGTYESELHPWIASIADRRFSAVIDIGVKFGYYAVGMALLRPDLPVIAFDIDPWARRATHEMALLNGVAERVRVEGFCRPEWLRQECPLDSLIICDIDGGEVPLLRAGFGKPLRSATLIIETHDCIVPNTQRTLEEQFAPTHTIEIVESGRVPPATPVDLRFLSEEESLRARSELRPPQTWLLCTPRPDARGHRPRSA